jgi:hypothetical protein
MLWWVWGWCQRRREKERRGLGIRVKERWDRGHSPRVRSWQGRKVEWLLIGWPAVPLGRRDTQGIALSSCGVFVVASLGKY